MFDTLLYTKKLEAIGMTRSEAEVQVNLIAEMIVDGVATRQDIEILRGDTAHLRSELTAEISSVRADLTAEINSVRTELTAKINAVHTELKSEISDLRSEIKLDLLSLERKLTLRLGAMLIASTTLTIAVLGVLR